MQVNFLLQHPPAARMPVQKADPNGGGRGGQAQAEHAPPEPRTQGPADTAAAPEVKTEDPGAWVSLGGPVSAGLYDKLGNRGPPHNSEAFPSIASGHAASDRSRPAIRVRRLLAKVYGD